MNFSTGIKSVGALLALAGAAFAADYTAWSGHRSIVLNTSATGANVTGTVTNFPVLIRLGGNEADILAAANGGASIRFSKADNTTPLPYQIESWSASSAAIWVKVDTVFGNNSTQSIRLHWGNAAATSESNGAAVFDTANGFRGVWHLNDSTVTGSTDATVLATNATWHNGPVRTAGLIGGAVDLNQPEGLAPENAKYLRADYNIANNNFKATSANGITLSAWVKRTMNSGGAEQGILGRYNWGQNARQAMIALNGSDQIRLFRSTNGTNSGGAETNFGTAVITDGQWFHIVATVRNGAQVLYVNGVQNVAQATATIGSLDSVWANSSALAFGRMAPDHAGNPVHQAFHGVIDEARYTAVARSADWVKLEFENQKAVNALANIGLPTAPGATAAPTGTSGNGQVTLAWAAPANNGGATITGYKAMAVSDTTKFCVTTGATTCVVTGLTNGTAYTFVVRASNQIGAGPLSPASSAVTPAPVAPGAPTGVTATGGTTGGTIVVTWTAPTNTGGAAITGYKAMVFSDTTKFCTWTSGPLTCTITGLAQGVYTIAVRASNVAGSGPTGLSLPVAGLDAAGGLVFRAGGFARGYTFVLNDVAALPGGSLTMIISDASGKTIWEKTVDASVREIAWNGRAAKGGAVAPGLYIARVRATGTAGGQDMIKAGITLRPQ